MIKLMPIKIFLSGGVGMVRCRDVTPQRLYGIRDSTITPFPAR